MDEKPNSLTISWRWLLNCPVVSCWHLANLQRAAHRVRDVGDRGKEEE